MQDGLLVCVPRHQGTPRIAAGSDFGLKGATIRVRPKRVPWKRPDYPAVLRIQQNPELPAPEKKACG